MADEITITARMSLSNNALAFTQNKVNQKYDQSTAEFDAGTQNIGTSEENLSVTVTTPGYLYLENLDSTNYVQWGQDNSSTMQTVGRLKAGEIALFRVDSGQTVRMQANTAAVDIYYVMFND